MTPLQKQYKRLREEIDKQKDEDIKTELRKGNIIKIIEDY
jgi:hypothetical protein